MPAPTPADIQAALELFDQELPVREIAARTCIPVVTVREVVAQHRSPAAPKDARVEALIDAALKSHRQPTRTKGERLRTLLAEVAAVVAKEAAQIRAQQRAAEERRKLREKVGRLAKELAVARAELKAKNK